MARVTRVKPNYKKFGPSVVGPDGYMLLPKNMNYSKVFSTAVQIMIERKMDSWVDWRLVTKMLVN